MRIAIWGMGVSGVSALRAVSKDTSNEIYAINKGKPTDWTNFQLIEKLIPKKYCLTESESLIELEIDQIILSPGVDRKSKLVGELIQRGVEVISEIEFSFRQVEIPIVAITGTNGKTTTTTMVSECLKIAGKNVFVGGNIGTPFCDILLDDNQYDIAVLELSSFQLESLQSFKADIAIVLNISESHMERYESFQDYVNAKLNIFNNQTSDDLAIAPREYLPLEGTLLERMKGIDLASTNIIGDHHLYNLFCASKVLEFFEISNPQDLINDFLTSFKGVSYRLQPIGEHNGARYINDAKSTNPSSTLSACESFIGSDYHLIMGGKVRDESTQLGPVLGEINPKKIFAFGEAGNLISKQLSQKVDVKVFENLQEIFEFIKAEEIQGSIVFSPGFPSFDQYKNYMDRGEHFNLLYAQYSS